MANPDARNANADPRGDTRPVQHNKAGHRQPTSRNEPRRTPESRHDRESHLGGSNQVQSRRNGRHG